jgi:hypothetical protein
MEQSAEHQERDARSVKPGQVQQQRAIKSAGLD